MLLNVNRNIVDIAMEILEYGSSSDLEIFFGAAWAIWCNRNRIVCKFSSQMPGHIWSFAKKYICEFKKASKACAQSWSRSEGKWLAPPPDIFKINVDGATSDGEKNSSVGVVIRDSAGNIVAACCKYLQGKYLVEEVEALAMECGLLLAKEQKLSQIILESDALVAVNSVSATGNGGCLGHIYQGIHSLLASFNSWKIKHVKREYNKTAHELAQFGRQKELSQVWRGVGPPWLFQIVQEDSL